MPGSNPQSIAPSRYQVIPRTLIFLFRGEALLLIKGAAHKTWAGKYNAIGGHLERGEDALTSARRELFEETGLQCGLRLCGSLINNTGRSPGIAVYIFTGDCPEGEARASSEGTVEWVPLERISGLPLRFDDLQALLPRILQARREGIPFSARSYYDASGQLVMEFGE